MMNAPRRFRFLNQEEFNALGSQERVDYLREALAPASLEPAIEARPAHPSLYGASLRAVAETLRAKTRRTQFESEAAVSELARTLARSRKLVKREPQS